MQFIWETFNLLDYQRGSDFGNPQPIKFSDILSYSALSGFEFESWEVETLIALDRLKLNQMYSDMEKERQKSSK